MHIRVMSAGRPQPQTITLDGRDFRIDEPIPSQLAFLRSLFRSAGVEPILERLTPEGFESCWQELLANISVRGLAFVIVAGVAIEIGKDGWTTSEAICNASRFAEITDPQEKQAMADGLSALAFAFLASCLDMRLQAANSSSGGSAASVPREMSPKGLSSIGGADGTEAPEPRLVSEAQGNSLLN